MTVLSAVVFDFDGLILDTETPIFRAWAEVFESFGVTALSMQEWESALGTVGGLDPVRELTTRCQAAGFVLDTDVAHKSYLSRRDTLISEQLLRPGVLDWLQAASALDVPIGLATSSPRAWATKYLSELGVISYFSALACFGDPVDFEAGTPTLPAKPLPDLYLAACRALGSAPGATLALEDSPNGIRAAKAAGLCCIAVPNDMTRHLDLSGADRVVSSLSDLDPSDVLGSIGPPW